MHATPRPISPRNNKEAIIRARCDTALKDLLQQAATRMTLDESDVIRIAVREYAGRVVYAPSAIHGQG